MENIPCGSEGLSCTKSVTFTIHDTVIHMVRGTTPIITHNPLATDSTPEAEYEIERAGVFMTITTAYG